MKSTFYRSKTARKFPIDVDTVDDLNLHDMINHQILRYLQSSLKEKVSNYFTIEFAKLYLDKEEIYSLKSWLEENWENLKYLLKIKGWMERYNSMLSWIKISLNEEAWVQCQCWRSFLNTQLVRKMNKSMQDDECLKISIISFRNVS